MTSFCPYCKSERFEQLYDTFDIFSNTYTMVECQDCKAVYLSPNPKPELLAKAYDDSYYGGKEDDEKFEGFVEKGLHYFRKRRAKKISKLLGENACVLDIGCGNGQFLEMLSTLGQYRIYGTEMAGSSGKRASKVQNLNLHIGDLLDAPFTDQQFDCITLFHVFEHLTEPERYLTAIDDLLKPGGYLVMSFPNIDSWQARFFKGKWLHLDPTRHLFFFRPKIFKALMTQAGFTVVNQTYFSVEQNPYGAIQSWFNLYHKKRELLFEHLKGHTAYTQGHSRLLLGIEKLSFILLTPLFIMVDFIASLFGKSATVEFVLQKHFRI